MQNDKLLRLEDVIDITTLSKPEIYRRIKDGSFPASHRLSHKLAVWKHSELQTWIANVN